MTFGEDEDEDEKIDIRSGVAKTGRWSNKISPLADSVGHSNTACQKYENGRKVVELTQLRW
jgi:hypothetical protein